MKLFFALLVFTIAALPAHAEKVRPAGWSEGNNKTTGNARSSGNEIRSVKEEKERKAEMTRKMREALTAQKTGSGKDAPKFKKNKNGNLTFQQKIAAKRYRPNAVQRLWNDIIN